MDKKITPFPITPFHLAIAVRDIDEARAFYVDILKCGVGRSSDEWIDLDLYGHQLVCHLDKSLGKDGKITHHVNPVDEHAVPIPHFGVVLEMSVWKELSEQLQDKVNFIIEPYIRFEGQVGEQATMFFKDPSGNALEFKAFQDIEGQLFAH